MNVIVCVKQTFDTEAVIQLDGAGRIDESSVKFIINPFDEFAVEEAIRLKEKEGGRVTVVSAAGRDPSMALRQCLAMGADRAVWLDCSGLECGMDPHVYAELLGRWLQGEDYDLIFCGKEAIDDGASEVPSRLAAVLDLPQVNVISSFELKNGKAEVTRDIQGGVAKIEVPIPCVISAQKGLNDPRYPSMRRVLQAKKAKIETVTVEDLGLDPGQVSCWVEIEGYVFPPRRQGGRILEGSHEEAVAELLGALKNERSLI